MRLALRARKTIHISRKDVADHAGVTPALVTYYYPRRDDLIEAATFPIVCAMVDAVEYHLQDAKPPQDRLLGAIDILIASYARDAAIIDLFASHRASRPEKNPDALAKIEAALLAFFEDWLKQSNDSIYDAVYLQQATIGMCKIVARCDRPQPAQEIAPPAMTQAQAICTLLLGPVASPPPAPVSGVGAAPGV